MLFKYLILITKIILIFLINSPIAKEVETKEFRYGDLNSSFLINNFEIEIPTKSLKDFIRETHKRDLYLSQIDLNIKNIEPNKIDYYYPLLLQNFQKGYFKIKSNN